MVFADFLEDVISDKNDNKEFDDIEALKNRFRNLRKENERLMERKQAIYQEIESTKAQERTTLAEMQAKLYQMQREM